MSEIKENAVAETVEETSEPSAPIRDTSLPIITMKKCIDAKCFYGYRTSKRNPKMNKYIHSNNHGVSIIDLDKTVEKIIESYIKMRDIAMHNGKVLFVGTKESIADVIHNEAQRCGSFYVNHRWLGGTLTNFQTILLRIRHLKKLDEMFENLEIDKLSKKEQSIIKKEHDKLEYNLGGLLDRNENVSIEMRKVPDAIFVCDPIKDAIAVKEAKKLGIKVFGIVNTNADPESVDYPIPANNEAVSSVELIVSLIADAIVEGKGGETLISYTKDEGGEATMADAVRLADRTAKEKILAIKNARLEKLKRLETAQKFANKDSFKPVGVSDKKPEGK